MTPAIVLNLATLSGEAARGKILAIFADRKKAAFTTTLILKHLNGPDRLNLRGLKGNFHLVFTQCCSLAIDLSNATLVALSFADTTCSYIRAESLTTKSSIVFLRCRTPPGRPQDRRDWRSLARHHLAPAALAGRAAPPEAGAPARHHMLDFSRCRSAGAFVVNQCIFFDTQLRLNQATIGGPVIGRETAFHRSINPAPGFSGILADGAELQGGLSLTPHFHCEGHLIFNETRFDGDVTLSGAVLLPSLRPGALRGADDAANFATYTLPDDISEETRSLDEEVWRDKSDLVPIALNLESAQIHGDVFLDRCFLAAGEVRMTSSEVEGGVNVLGACLYAVPPDRPNAPDTLQLRALTLDGARIGGDLFLMALPYHDEDIEQIAFPFLALGQVSMSGANIRGYMACSGGTFINPRWRRSPIANAIAADLVVVGGSVRLDDGFIAIGAIGMAGIRTPLLDCTAAIVAVGQLDYGHQKPVLDLMGAQIEADAIFGFGSVYAGTIRLDSMVIGGDLHFSAGIYLAADRTIRHVGKEEKAKKETRRHLIVYGEAISLVQAQIGGNVLFYETSAESRRTVGQGIGSASDRRKAMLAVTYSPRGDTHTFSSRVCGRILGDFTHIRGGLDLRRISLHRAQVYCRHHAHHYHPLGQTLEAVGLLENDQRLGNGEDLALQFNQARIDGDVKLGHNSIFIGKVEFVATQIGGDVDLAGSTFLQLQQSEPAGQRTRTDARIGALRLRRAVIRGQLRTMDWSDDKPCPARIYGGLDLSGLQVQILNDADIPDSFVSRKIQKEDVTGDRAEVFTPWKTKLWEWHERHLDCPFCVRQSLSDDNHVRSFWPRKWIPPASPPPNAATLTGDRLEVPDPREDIILDGMLYEQIDSSASGAYKKRLAWLECQPERHLPLLAIDRRRTALTQRQITRREPGANMVLSVGRRLLISGRKKIYAVGCNLSPLPFSNEQTLLRRHTPRRHAFIHLARVLESRGNSRDAKRILIRYEWINNRNADIFSRMLRWLWGGGVGFGYLPSRAARVLLVFTLISGAFYAIDDGIIHPRLDTFRPSSTDIIKQLHTDALEKHHQEVCGTGDGTNLQPQIVKWKKCIGLIKMQISRLDHTYSYFEYAGLRAFPFVSSPKTEEWIPNTLLTKLTFYCQLLLGWSLSGALLSSIAATLYRRVETARGTAERSSK